MNPHLGPLESSRRSLHILLHLHRDASQDVAEEQKRRRRRRRLDKVLRRLQRKTRQLAQRLHRLVAEPRVRAYRRPDRGPAEVHLVQLVHVPLHEREVRLQRGRERVKLLPERHRDRVLELRSTHLDDAAELVALRAQRRDELAQRVHHRRVPEHDRELGRGRVRVVRALAQVHVVVRTHRGVVPEREAHASLREVRDHLVRVHVRARPGAALDDVHGEVLVERVVLQKFVARGRDRVVDVSREEADLEVGARARLLDERERANEVRVRAELDAGDVVVLHRARGRDAVQRVSRDEHRAYDVALEAMRAPGSGRRGHVRVRGRRRGRGGRRQISLSCGRRNLDAFRRGGRRERRRRVGRVPAREDSERGDDVTQKAAGAAKVECHRVCAWGVRWSMPALRDKRC